MAAGEGEDERGEGEREYEYCIEANVVVYTSRGVNTRAKTFSRGAFSLRVTHGDPRAHTHAHAHARVGPSCVENGHGRREFT